jgi:hypothetical protein
MTKKDQVCVVDVMVIDLTWDIMALSVNTKLLGVVAELSAIAKVYKYRGLHEERHFIPMAMEVHNTPMHDMDCFIMKCAHLSTTNDLEVIYPYFFAFNFLGNMLVLPFNVL